MKNYDQAVLNGVLHLQKNMENFF